MHNEVLNFKKSAFNNFFKYDKKDRIDELANREKSVICCHLYVESTTEGSLKDKMNPTVAGVQVFTGYKVVWRPPVSHS